MRILTDLYCTKCNEIIICHASVENHSSCIGSREKTSDMIWATFGNG